jgi:hypothetical protein
VNTWLSRLGSRIAEPDDESREPGRPAFDHDPARVAASVAAALAMFVVAEPALNTTCRLDAPPVSASSLLGACATARPLRVVAVAALYALALIAVPRLRQGWDQFEGGRVLRWFAAALALALAWSASAYAYNPWYDQAHVFDRLATLTLAALVFVRPAFIPPFLFAFSAVIWQLQWPALGFGILVAEFRPLTSVLTVLACTLLLQSIFGYRKMTGFLFLTLCIVAADFWVPAFAKLRIGWITHGHVYLLLPNAYTHGWLAFLSPDTIASATRTLAAADWPMRIVTFAIECAAIVTLASARVTRAMLILFTALLCGFFATLGYLFWKWMVLQAALLAVLFARSDVARGWRRELFTWPRFVVSIVVIAAAPLWLGPAALAWFDSPLADTLHYEATGPSGVTYDLGPAFFAPYESHMAMASFAANVVPDPMLVGAYGVADKATAARLLDARTLDDVERLERAVPRRDAASQQQAVEEYLEFIRRALRVSNRRLGEGRSPFDFLRPPPFLWTFSRERVYDRREPLETLRICRVSSLFGEGGYRIIRKQLLHTVTVGR